MKTYQIKEDGAKYQLAENAGDLNIVRFSALKNIIAEGSSGMEYADLTQWFKDRRALYNANDIYGLMTSEMNMQKGVADNFSRTFNDVSHKIFSLMILEEGELPENCDSTQLDEKLKRMSIEGLNQKEVSDVTANFIEASPELLNSYFLMSLVALSKQLKFSEHLANHMNDLQNPSPLQTA